MASSSSSSGNYEVFLNFRGEDTRRSFTCYLYDALNERKKIRTFIDDEGLGRGDEISDALLNAIQGSKISVVIFSKDYASSKWCLNELVKILECKNTNGQIVIPVFYGVSPSNVRHQEETFGNGFKELKKQFEEKAEMVLKWKNALTGTSHLAGLESTKFSNDAQLVNKIVEDVLKNLEKATVATDSSNGLVGLNSRIEQIKPFLCMDLSDTVQIVGIWGMGGIGKTTLATAIFNQFSSEFEGRCFLSDIRKNSETGGGLEHLQKQMLSTILSEKLEVAGANIPHFTKERVRRMKVLIVLDDVNEVGQLEGLIGELDQFGPGSRIVVTTRDKRVLEKFRGEKKIYRVNGLEFEEAFEHFCNFAFEENHCPEDLNWHSQRVVEYADGNPLVPKVLGSSLCLKRKSHWENLLHDLNRICESDIHDIYKKLKITFDELTPRVQSIFLDIACFFEGEDKDFVARILDDSESDGLDVLIDKSLISISGNCLQMHDLLQEMGRQIVRQESEKEPGKRSRLCDPKEIRRVLKHNKGTDAIEGISLDLSKIKGINLDSGAFTNMSNLRLLKFYVPKLLGMSIEEQLSDSKVLLPDGLDYLPKNLRYLHWDKYPLRTLPSNFKPENLVELNLHFSKVEQLWEGKKEAFKLKSINLSHCRHFIDMSYPSAPNLETYLLDYTNLACVPSSIQNFKYLSALSFEGCKSLRSFPSNFRFVCPVTINFSSCVNLIEFPQISGKITRLYLGQSAIEEVPSSIECLTDLEVLDLRDCKRLKRISTRFCKLRSLVDLFLHGCLNLQSLPALPLCLKSLDLRDCKMLQSLPELPSCLEALDLTSCNMVRSLPELPLCLKCLYLRDCKMLQSLPALPSCLKSLDLGDCKILQSLPAVPSCLKSLDLRDCKMLQSLPALPSCLKYRLEGL
ncbi:disease resistance-like protein DSC1 [Citrus clementina]|uniref:disease resistance-like protein DSC1 n=1 Tax=Citrus clementina TaxID=85681 RepID=UPI000CED147F|nr:disease resistance-like protein DSC1 [Citrus x clementina]